MPEGTALYTLSDPRDVRTVRYVGQTRAPRRRYQQHVAAARLGLAGEMPWWVIKPALRPLYEWLRELWSEGGRLPVMVVVAWVPEDGKPLLAERELIRELLSRGLPLLNVEAERAGGQRSLL